MQCLLFNLILFSDQLKSTICKKVCFRTCVPLKRKMPDFHLITNFFFCPLSHLNTEHWLHYEWLILFLLSKVAVTLVTQWERSNKFILKYLVKSTRFWQNFSNVKTIKGISNFSEFCMNICLKTVPACHLLGFHFEWPLLL